MAASFAPSSTVTRRLRAISAHACAGFPNENLDPRILASQRVQAKRMRDSMPAELLELMKPTMGGSGEIPTAPDPLPTWEENAAQAASGPMFKMREAMGPPFSDDATLASLVELGEGIDISAHTTTGVDGNEIVLDFFRPTDAQGDIPCIYYIHGGGMASMSMRLNNFQQFARLVARQGVAVCLVEFRNSVDATEAAPTIAPFPAGLNDCMTGLEWLDANRKVLGIGAISVAGESGGGNLAIATALKAKQEGKLSLLPNGVFALCPYIAGNWPQDETHTDVLGSSHVDNAQAPLVPLMQAVGYGIEAFEAKNPLAWPSFASVKELEGFPRTVISVNEGDIFRDEGILFYRKLLAAGVTAECRQVMGTPHAADINMWTIIPEICLSTARAMADFAANGEVQLQRMHTDLPR